jgi:hypothetical protein
MISQLFFQGFACSLSPGTEFSDIIEEFIDSSADSTKSSCVSFFESVVELIKEFI